MAKSRSKYTRARIRAAGRRPKKRGGATWFYSLLALIVVGGVVGVALARPDSADAVPPQPGNPATGAPGDHWHAAIAANICGTWLGAAAEFETAADNPNVRSGIHTHGDGFIHIHPFTASEGGTNATLDRFLTYGGWLASETSLELWSGPASAPDRTTWSNGDKCPPGTPFAGQKGVVQWSIDCAPEKGDPSRVKLEDQAVYSLAFLPKGEDIGVPPNATATPADDGSGATPLDNAGCSTEGPGATSSSTTTSLAGVTTDSTAVPETPTTTP
ncbi:MAG TPA: hypothetical protein VFW06_08270 [Acidimicrobiia bacterium]|nr:hypothetical protein [Acidimicrobiia bacterium]